MNVCIFLIPQNPPLRQRALCYAIFCMSHASLNDRHNLHEITLRAKQNTLVIAGIDGRPYEGHFWQPRYHRIPPIRDTPLDDVAARTIP
jgi:hypothetical protein